MNREVNMNKIFPIIFTLMITLTAMSALEWTGLRSTDWSDGLNWHPLGVPNLTTDVVIPYVTSGNYPETSTADGSCRTLLIAAGASVAVGSYDLSVAMDMDIHGQLCMTDNTDLDVHGDITWHDSSSVDITDSDAEIYAHGNMTFEADTNVDFEMGHVKFVSSSDNCYIINHSPDTWLPSVRNNVSYPYFLAISNSSTHNFYIRGDFANNNGATFYGLYSGYVWLYGDLLDYNTGVDFGLHWDYGTLVLIGGSHFISLGGSYSYLNHLHIETQFTVTLNHDLTVKGDLAILSGILNPVNYTIKLGGDWINAVGPDAFTEGNSTVNFNGNADQYCNCTEQFKYIIISNTGGAWCMDDSTAVVSCDYLDWTYGSIKVFAGTLNIGNLTDQYISGVWYVYLEGEINIYDNTWSSSADLGGELHILGGRFYIEALIFPATWPQHANAVLEMTGGSLEVVNPYGIVIDTGAWTLNENITGGTIITNGYFEVNRTDFNPAGGTVEMTGIFDSQVYLATGSNFFNLKINKPNPDHNTVTAMSALDINGNFVIEAGHFVAPPVMTVRGNWNNLVDPTAFAEGTGLVILDGNLASTFNYDEEFNMLELNKDTASYQLRVNTGAQVKCNSYNWTQGKLYVSGGTFIALDMPDNAILGTVQLTSGSIHFYRDTGAGQYLDLAGDLIIAGGELHLHGACRDSYWPNGGNGSLIMGSGLIYRHGYGIYLLSTNTFNSYVTGGTICCDGSFKCYRSTFSHSGWTLDLAGASDAELDMYAGSVHDLVINKAARDGTRANTITLANDLTCTGTLTVAGGKLDLNHYTAWCSGNVIINAGTLQVDNLAYLYLANGNSLEVNSDGRLEAVSLLTPPAFICSSGGYYDLNVNSGGTIAARNARFLNVSDHGVNVRPGAIVDPSHSFYACYFSDGEAGGTLLTLDNSDIIQIVNAEFPTNTWSGASNVTKNVNSGVVNFTNATGAFYGEANDNDIHNRVFWNTATPSYDLKVLRAEWSPATPDPLLGDPRTLKVTVVNSSTTTCGVGHWLHLYYDRATAPAVGEPWDQTLHISSLPAGLPVDYEYYVSNYDPAMAGEWDSWLLIDGDGEVAEGNENNNHLGPVGITWLPLPTVQDIAIHRHPVYDRVYIEWSYPISVTRFNVYSDSDASGDFSHLEGTTDTTLYIDNIPAAQKFYLVKAEREEPAK